MAAAAEMTRQLALGTCDAVVLHVHEYAIGRWGRAQVDCHEGAGESVVDQVVSGLRDAGITVKGVIGSADYGHVARAILEAADQCDARMIVLGSSSRTRPAPPAGWQRIEPAAAHGEAPSAHRAEAHGDRQGL